MSACKFIVNDLNIKKNQLKIDAALVTETDYPVPKIRVIFRRGEDIRRLPLIKSGSFKRMRSSDYVSIYSYNYLLDYIFTDEVSDDDITLSFEIEEEYEQSRSLDFYVSKGIISKFPEANIDEKYAGGEDFSGATVYSNPAAIEETEDVPLKSYICIPCPQSGEIILRVKENYALKTSRCKVAAVRFITEFMCAVNVFICALLVPYFVFDAFLAALDIIPRHRAPEETKFIRIFISQIKANIASYLRFAFKNQNTAEKLIRVEEGRYARYYKRLCKKPVVENRVSFISGRRDEIGGNEKYVYDLLKDRDDIDFQFLMNSELDRGTKNKAKKKFYELYATSKVVIVDDYYNLLNSVEKREGVTLFQLWHACGAFKTFGFSRLGKSGGPKQTSPSHRMYDCATVSSDEIVKYYAEGFGVSDSHILPTGIPRTDIFCDKEYAENIKNGFFTRYPKLKGKKIIMFAPTFRGAGQKSAYYPLSVFDPNRFYEAIGDEYAVIIKLHPFCTERFEIEKKYSDYIIDLSDEDELNDLLFVTDLLITDYSSAVFEASLLNIPMLFYPYDLYQYISERDFYCEYESFVPGRIAFTFDEVCESVVKGDYEEEKIEPFRHKFFTHLDGKSSQRVADIIIEKLKG
ncbi:MAG: CDP-glycerol glycerophosphotransferase family protein [Clostridia bacterium]|nr:CDP-glycerol glycerophosphotransferase family protein [Clostridia bacterium]